MFPPGNGSKPSPKQWAAGGAPAPAAPHPPPAAPPPAAPPAGAAPGQPNPQMMQRAAQAIQRLIGDGGLSPEVMQHLQAALPLLGAAPAAPAAPPPAPPAGAAPPAPPKPPGG